jgi:DNA primase
VRWQKPQNPIANVEDIVVNVLGIEGKHRGNELDFLCPVHDDRRPSAGVNLESGHWHCLACGAGGDLASLAVAVKGLSPQAAAALVKPDTPTALIASLQRTVHGRLGALQGTPDPPPLPHYPTQPPDYLRGRGYTDETLQSYGVGYVQGDTLRYDRDRTISIRDYAAIPIRDEQDHLLAWCYRACHDTNLRYLYTPGVKIADLWFGINLHADASSVVVTEGALDSMWVHQAGHPAIAMLGASNKSPSKVRALTQYRRVTLFLDHDAAGVRAVYELGEIIACRVPTLVARYPKGVTAKDPADLTPEQVTRAIKRAIPYSRWRNP